MKSVISIPSLTVPPDTVDNSAVPNQVQGVSGSDQNKLNNVDESGFDRWKSTASAAVKLFLRGTWSSADAFPPLKSVVGGLCFILENCEVQQPPSIHSPQCLLAPQRTKANKQAIESLAPRVKVLSASICEPISEGDVKEEMRRGELEW